MTSAMEMVLESAAGDDVKIAALEALGRSFAINNVSISNNSFVMGQVVPVADAAEMDPT